MTASCKHDLILKLPSASRNPDSGRKMHPVGLLFLQHSVLPLSDLYQTLPVLYHNKNILAIFFEIPVLVSHQNHHHQYTFFCLPNLDIGHKTESHEYRNVGKFVLSG